MPHSAKCSHRSRSSAPRARCRRAKLAAKPSSRAAGRRRAPSPVSAPLVFRGPAQPVVENTPLTAAQHDHAAAKAAKRKLEDGLWAAYFKSESEETRNALWVHYQPLVRFIAERLKTKLPECIDVHDLIGAGNIGLQDAIAKFEPSVGVRFETYCVPRIRGAILDSIRALDWVPRLIRNKNHQYERIVRELAAELHREPREDEVAARLGLNPAEFCDLQKELKVKAQISVEGHAKNGADDRDLLRLEMIESRRDFEPTENLQRDEIRAMALKGLNSKERAVVEQYYFRGRSMKQIGDELQLSESRICQIHSQVLEVLRKKFKAYRDSCTLD